MGRPKGQRHAAGEGQRQAGREVGAKNLLRGANPYALAGAAKARAARRDADSGYPELQAQLQGMDILGFAGAAGFSFGGRPGQELVLRLLHGLGLPEGMVKTYVRRPADGFVLEPAEMSWLEYYRLLTGNDRLFEPGEEPTEAYLCVGARSGKSTITAIEATYQATRNKWLDYLRVGETAYAGIIATNLDQARDIIQRNCYDMLHGSALLQPLIKDVGRQQIKLINGLGIRSFPCNSRAPRGFPYFFTCYDEAAWYFTEGAKCDEDVDAAMNPRRMQFPGGKHMSISTPAGKQGLFYKLHAEGARVHRRVTITAPTWTFRPELVDLNPEFLQREYEKDPFQFNREYGAEFDEVVQPFLPEGATQICLNLPAEVPPDRNIQYFLGIDASGLSGNDKFGAGVAGKDTERNRFVVALERSWPDKNPDPILADLDDIAKKYGIRYAFTDRYAKGWVHAALRKIHIEPVLCPDAATVWSNFRTLVDGKKIDMPDTKSLQAGLLSTQASYTASNRVTITRRRDRTGHGDEAEAVVRAVYGASQETYYGRRETEADRAEAARQKQEEEEYDPLVYGRV